MESLMRNFLPAQYYGHPPFNRYSAALAAPIYPEPISPLDLSVKTSDPIMTPPCTPSPHLKHHDNIISSYFQTNDSKPKHSSDDEGLINLASKKRPVEEDAFKPSAKLFKKSFAEDAKTPKSKNIDRSSPEIDVVLDLDGKFKKSPLKQVLSAKKNKAVRRLTFDEDKSSPVSGTIIRELADDEMLVVRKGDIDPAFNMVEITEEAKATLASIENKLGSYICRLCRQLYEDAFTLAQHRCSRIVHIEYRCPECDKVFNCPANLASHRRWHKPRHLHAVKNSRKFQDPEKTSDEQEARFTCNICGKIFRRQAYLKKHLAAHQAGDDKEINSEGDAVDGYGYPKRLDDYGEEKDKTQEFSAFRLVGPEVRRRVPYEDEIRDSNFNTFWSKNHPTINPSFLAADCESSSDRLLRIYESERPTSSIASVHSEDSQTLDITGSEDEGNNDAEDPKKQSKMDEDN